MKRFWLISLIILLSIITLWCTKKINIQTKNIQFTEKIKIELKSHIQFFRENFITEKDDIDLEKRRNNESNNQYKTLGEYVFFGSEKIENADINSFTPLIEWIALDKNNIFCEGNKIPLETGKFSFVSWTINYTTDWKKVFFWCKEIIGADANSFIWLSGTKGIQSYATDKNWSYFFGKKIPNQTK